ncbi:MAG: UvrD-helicase domain-containing protein, partial [Thermoguttaceae bacterium]|nr:UvrD-helicase domain-containing protein [Thermoguttaceae bacterium]
FTNKAAREMQERVAALLPKRDDKTKPEISTFHSLCVRILRRQIHRIGYPNQFAIYDRGDQESIARQVLKDYKFSSGALRPGDFIRQIGDWKNAGVRPDKALEIVESSKAYLCASAYGKYQARMKNLGAVDFDDILLLTQDVFGEYPETLDAEAARFDHILIDEYQDTNQIQYEIAKGLALPTRNLCVVGDDDQAIYGWRGAEVRHILNFQRDWPEAKVVRLEENYRSTLPILTWANRLIAINSVRHEKRLKTAVQGESPRIIQCKTAEEEAARVVLSIRARMEETKRKPCDFAILFRTNDQPRAFEMALRASKIPYVVAGGQSFFDRKEVKDLIAYLKALRRPQDDVSLLRVVNTPPRGIGSITIAKIRDYAVANGKPIWDAIKKDDEFLASLDARSREALGAFVALITEEGAKLRRNFSVDALKKFIEKINY